MARITVEDCLNNVDNRFELVLLATKRTRQIEAGHEPMVSWDGDKPTVVALREIADDKITLKRLEEIEAEQVASADSEAEAWGMAIEQFGG